MAMNAKEFLAFMDGPGGEQLKRECEAEGRRQQEAYSDQLDAIGDHIEKHPIGAVYAHQVRHRRGSAST